MKYDNLRKVRERIASCEPKLNIMEKYSCKTACCIAGHACILLGRTLEEITDLSSFAVETSACKFLGLPDKRLFRVVHWTRTARQNLMFWNNTVPHFDDLPPEVRTELMLEQIDLLLAQEGK